MKINDEKKMEQEEGGLGTVPVGRNINTPIAFILLLHGIPPVIQASNFPEISEKLEHCGGLIVN